MKMQTPHLTQEQISELVADPACALAGKMQQHMAECPACSADVLALRQTLTGFRLASTAYAAAQPMRAPRPAAEEAPRRFAMPARNFTLWAATAAAAVVAVAVPAGLHPAKPRPAPVAVVHAPVPTVETATARPALSDEELMASIEQDLSATVPTSMLPLAEPIPSTDSASVSTPVQRSK